jgi:broad specificity phosphatase PhoE
VSESGLLLIRHAESSWNAARRWQGHGNPPLSDRGVEQARGLAIELAPEDIDVIVSSDLRRAVETAAILGEARGLRPLLDPRLRELDLGDWEGRTRDEIERAAGDALRRFDGGDLDVRPGGGENLRELAAAHAGRRLAVVTHLGVIRALSSGTVVGNACWRRLSRAELTASGRAGGVAPRRSPGANL